MERNLFTETIGTLARHGHTLDHIEHVTLYDTGIKLDEFVQFAEEFDYNYGYGHEWVPPFVLKMCDDTWYERAEYDGSEWWTFHAIPKAPVEYTTILGALVANDATWSYPEASAHAEEIEYEEMWRELDAEYEEIMREQLMDELCDEYESLMDVSVIPSKKNWHVAKGKCADKAHCKREVRNENRYELGGGFWAKPNSRCWKDQRGSGRRRRDTQYRA